MKTSNYLALKVAGVTAAVLYLWSLLWVSMVYLYGGLYVPLREVGLRDSIYFEIFVALLSLSIYFLIFFKLKGNSFWKLLLQDLVLIVISVPFFALLLGVFGKLVQSNLIYTVLLLLTILTININDWVKTKHTSR